MLGSGASWPDTGEIDILEGVNDNDYNSMTLHTTAGRSVNNVSSAYAVGEDDMPAGASSTLNSTLAYTDRLVTSNCDTAASGQPQNAGCVIQAPSPQSQTSPISPHAGNINGKNPSDNSTSEPAIPAIFGTAFNAQGGGTYAMQWTATSIRIWVFPYDWTPADIASGSPDPDSWPTLFATFAGECEFT